MVVDASTSCVPFCERKSVGWPYYLTLQNSMASIDFSSQSSSSTSDVCSKAARMQFVSRLQVDYISNAKEIRWFMKHVFLCSDLVIVVQELVLNQKQFQGTHTRQDLADQLRRPLTRSYRNYIRVRNLLYWSAENGEKSITSLREWKVV